MDEASDMPAEQRIKYVNITLDKAKRLEQLINEFFEITRYNLQHIELQKGIYRPLLYAGADGGRILSDFERT